VLNIIFTDVEFFNFLFRNQLHGASENFLQELEEVDDASGVQLPEGLKDHLLGKEYSSRYGKMLAKAVVNDYFDASGGIRYPKKMPRFFRGQNCGCYIQNYPRAISQLL